MLARYGEEALAVALASGLDILFCETLWSDLDG